VVVRRGKRAMGGFMDMSPYLMVLKKEEEMRNMNQLKEVKVRGRFFSEF